MRYILLLLIISSCSNTLYVPSTRNAPLFREQGEAQLSAYAGSGGVEGQVAYAVTDHLAVIGSYAFLNTKQSAPFSYDRKNSAGEIGFGYYERSRGARWELLGGYGMGQGTTADQYYFYGLNNTVVATGKMQRFFFQPSLGTNNRDFNLIFTPRFSWVSYPEFTAGGVVKKPNEKIQMFVEPSITAKFRLVGNIHGIMQIGMALPQPSDVFFKYSTTQTSIGIQIDTGGLRTKVY
jgi:hypothetical protein